MTVPAQWGLTFEFAFLPNQLVLCVENYEVVNICWWNEVLLATGTRVDAPPTEEDDVRSTDVRSMAVSRERRSSTYSNSRPEELFSVKDSNIVEIAAP